MSYRSLIRRATYFVRGSFNIMASSITHPLKPFELDGKTGKILARYNSDEEMRRGHAQHWVDYLTPTVIAVYDETVGDSSARERFETGLRKRLLERILED